MNKHYTYNIIEYVEHSNYLPRQYGAAVLTVDISTDPEDALKLAVEDAETMHGLNVLVTDFKEIK